MYNSERHLKSCLDSLINQSYKNLEIIIIDDGSTDTSGKICDEYAKNDNRIIVFHTENHGVSAARNLALKRFTGDYLAFVDADDWLEEHSCLSMLSAAENNNADICISEAQIEYGDKKIISGQFDQSIVVFEESGIKQYTYHTIPWKDNDFPNSIIFPVVWCKLFKRSILNGCKFDLDIKFGEDSLFCLDVVKNAHRIVGINQVTYHYRKDNDKSATGVYHLDRFFQSVPWLQKIKAHITTKVLFHAYSQMFYNLLLFSVNSLVNGPFKLSEKWKCFLYMSNSKWMRTEWKKVRKYRKAHQMNSVRMFDFLLSSNKLKVLALFFRMNRK